MTDASVEPEEKRFWATLPQEMRDAIYASSLEPDVNVTMVIVPNHQFEGLTVSDYRPPDPLPEPCPTTRVLVGKIAESSHALFGTNKKDGFDFAKVLFRRVRFRIINHYSNLACMIPHIDDKADTEHPAVLITPFVSLNRLESLARDNGIDVEPEVSSISRLLPDVYTRELTWLSLYLPNDFGNDAAALPNRLESITHLLSTARNLTFFSLVIVGWDYKHRPLRNVETEGPHPEIKIVEEPRKIKHENEARPRSLPPAEHFALLRESEFFDEVLKVMRTALLEDKDRKKLKRVRVYVRDVYMPKGYARSKFDRCLVPENTEGAKWKVTSKSTKARDVKILGEQWDSKAVVRIQKDETA